MELIQFLKGVMNMKVFLTTVLVIGLITIAGFTFAKTTTIPSETVKSSQAQSGEIEKEYAGMVVKIGRASCRERV